MRMTRRRVVQGLAAGGLAHGLPARALGRRRDGAVKSPGGPSERLIAPRRITATEGGVSAADALVDGGVCTMTARAGAPALLVVDYGRIVGGVPVFEVERHSGQLEMTSIYAQALPWLLPDGDGPAPGKPGATAAATKEISFVGFAGAANLSRVERIPLRRGRIVNRLIQGGQRFQALRLTGEGSVTLRGIGFVSSSRFPRSSPCPGRFECSDPALNEIWALGAYALDVASLPAGALPPLWDIGPQGATVYGDTYTGYQRGLAWTDYTVRFQVRIEEHEASWLVRAQPPDGIRFVLCAADDRLPKSTPNTLRAYVQFTQQLIATVPLPSPVRPGKWHSIETIVRGETISVSIDGKRAGEFPVPREGGFWGNTSAGWVALANASGAIATFRNLEVQAPDGSTLLRTPLTDPSILDEFAAGRSTCSTIVDGATRDRLLFTGDLGVASRTLLYTTFDLRYLTDSIGLFSRYQGADGAIPTSIPPQANLGSTPGNAFTAGLTDYTVQHVTTLHTYWMHTNDREFLRTQWPAVLGVFRYLRENTDPATELFAPPGPAGRVADTLTNAHYYGALKQAEAMAEALGEGETQRHLSALAAPLRRSINRHLFNGRTGLYGASTHDLETIDEQANAYAVLYRVAEESRIEDLLERLSGALHVNRGPLRSTGAAGRIISPYTAGYEVQARLDVGDTATALDLIRRAWQPMRRGGEYYSGATWEYVSLGGAPGLGSGTSLAHPWSSGPTAALSAYVLGVRALAPGFATWMVEPQIADLDWARGTVPTPRGQFDVHWTRKGRRLTVRVRAPRRTRGFVGVPLMGARGVIAIDGRAQVPSAHAEGRALSGYGYVGPLAAGAHEVTLERGMMR